MRLAVRRLWKYVGGFNGLLFVLYTIFVFATSALTNQHFSPYYFLFSILFIAALAIMICPRLMRFISRQSIQNGMEHENKQSYSAVLRIALYVIPFLVLLFLYVVYYPGCFSTDSVNQYNQVIKNEYNDWHPVLQTLFAFKLPLFLTGGWIGSIVLFQIICFSAVLGYCFNVILKYAPVKYTLVSVAVVVLNPQLGYMSLFPWKDVSFAIGALLLLTYSVQIYLSRGLWIKSPVNTAAFVVTASLTTLFRHNALLFTIPMVFGVLLCLTKRRGLIVCLSIAILCAAVKVPLYSAMGVKNPDERKIETLGLPMTVIGAVVTYNPAELDEETRAFAYKVAPEEVWSEKYSYGSYNQVKWDDRTNNEVIEEYGYQKVISMMFRSFMNSKYIALKALVKLAGASFSVASDSDDFVYPMVRPREFGMTRNINARAAAVCEGYQSFIEDYVAYPVFHLGFLHLLLIGVILSKCKLNKLADWKKLLFVIPVFVYNYGTTLLLTGREDSARFFFYTFPLMPVLLMFLLYNENEYKKDRVV